MIEIKRGNLLEANAEALVNTVNCVDIMGKGIALQFKQRFPDNFAAYERACRQKEVQIGRMFTVPTGRLINPNYIINFPTKTHWKGKSRIEDIEAGLQSLIEEVKRLAIKSIAVPPLGCGNGGLNWNEVRPLIEAAFSQLPEIRVFLYAPESQPKSEAMPVGTVKKELTRARALLINLIARYKEQGYPLTKLEIQKLAYFLQEAGEPMNLRYEKHNFGPYADNLNHVLQLLEGHYTRGYGDRNSQSAIHLMPGAEETATAFLDEETEVSERLEKVSRLIEGFETPYGLELLATVHWIAQNDPEAEVSPDLAIRRVHEWSSRKEKLFRPDHIQKAWLRLRDGQWFGRG
jgi:O-acetyl-ADP-ribose deacetylase (regulator of RNase III)